MGKYNFISQQNKTKASTKQNNTITTAKWRDIYYYYYYCCYYYYYYYYYCCCYYYFDQSVVSSGAEPLGCTSLAFCFNHCSFVSEYR